MLAELTRNEYKSLYIYGVVFDANDIIVCEMFINLIAMVILQ